MNVILSAIIEHREVISVNIVKAQKDVEKELVEMEGALNTEIQWLLRKQEGMPHFELRRFTMGKGGVIPLHTHEWEHELYFLSGRGTLLSLEGETPVEKDDVAYVDGTKKHGFKNTGEEDFVFLCLIPVVE